MTWFLYHKCWQVVSQDLTNDTFPQIPSDFRAAIVIDRRLKRLMKTVFTTLIVYALLGVNNLWDGYHLGGVGEPSMSSSLGSWAGAYVYMSSAGRTVGGSSVVVRYELTISPKTPG